MISLRMRSNLKGIFIFSFIFIAGCAAPRECLISSGAKGTLSYETAVGDRGQSNYVWKEKLTEKLKDNLGLVDLFGSAWAIVFTAGSSESLRENGNDLELVKTYVSISSLLDGRSLPAFIVSPKNVSDNNRIDLVILIHGHHESIEDMMLPETQMHGLAIKLAQAGFVALVPEIRSFGKFQIKGKNHYSYVRNKPDGEFLRETVADMFSAAEFAKQHYKNLRSLNVVGHSLGGYIALHLSALDPEIDRTVISGIFLPYLCINSFYHHSCQRFRKIEKFAEVSDIAGLIAPRKLLLHFGEDDKYHTSASDKLFYRTQKIYENAGVKEFVILDINPGRKHEVNPESIIRFLRK